MYIRKRISMSELAVRNWTSVTLIVVAVAAATLVYLEQIGEKNTPAPVEPVEGRYLM